MGATAVGAISTTADGDRLATVCGDHRWLGAWGGVRLMAMRHSGCPGANRRTDAAELAGTT